MDLRTPDKKSTVEIKRTFLKRLSFFKENKSLTIGTIILGIIVFMALALIPMLRQRREIRRLTEQIGNLEKAIDRLELEKDVYNPANHSDLKMDNSDLAKVSRKYTS